MRGHVLWLEDVSDIAALLKELEENKETIAESNNLEQENYRTKLKINTLQEKNRLYDLLHTQTAHQIDLLDSLLAQYSRESDFEKRRSLLGKISVIGAYIKRRGNLMFIGEKSDTTDTAELSLCLEESFANLELMGVECSVDIPDNNKINTKEAIRGEVKAQKPDCKIVLVVDENTEKKLADKVRQAKKDGLIDNFLYGSASATYLSAVIDTL